MTTSAPSAAALGTSEVAVEARSSDQTNAGIGTAACTVAPGLPPIEVKLAPLGTYSKNTTLSISASVVRTDSTPVVGASVRFPVTAPGVQPATKTVTTDGSGGAVWKYKVGPKAPAGTYTVTAVATLGGEAAAAVPEEFVVSPQGGARRLKRRLRVGLHSRQLRSPGSA